MHTTPVFDKDKAIQSALYVLQRIERKDMHKLFKVLYFADMEHLNKYGRSITGDTYMAMEYGPVPSAIYDMIKAVRGDGHSKIPLQELRKYFSVSNKMMVTPLCNADTDYLSESDIETLDFAIEKYGRLQWEDLVKKSHAYAWSETAMNHAISVENILKEKNADSEYIDFVTSNIKLQKQCLK